MSNSIQSSGLDDRLRKWAIPVFIEAPANQPYPLMSYVPVGFVVEQVTCQTSAGTCSLAFAISGSTITGLSAVAASVTPNTDTATALNTGSAGARLVMTVSSVAAATDLEVTLIGRYV